MSAAYSKRSRNCSVPQTGDSPATEGNPQLRSAVTPNPGRCAVQCRPPASWPPDKELDMHQRVFFALVALALSVVTVYGQQATPNPKKAQVICDSLAAVVPGAVEAYQRATVAVDDRDYQQAAHLYPGVLRRA